MNHPHWMQTHSGLALDLLDPQPDMICIEDIAHSLAQTCRYTGQCSRFYSVAEHSLVCANIIGFDLPIRFQALMHDATEAYVGDVASPLKALLPEYRTIEDRVWGAIAAKFGLPVDLDPRIKQTDYIALFSEKEVLLGPSPHPWQWGDHKADPKAVSWIRTQRFTWQVRDKFLNEFASISQATGLGIRIRRAI